MPSLKDEVLTLLVKIKQDMSIAGAKIQEMNESVRPAASYLEKAHEFVGRCQTDVNDRGNDVIPTIQRRF